MKFIPKMSLLALFYTTLFIGAKAEAETYTYFRDGQQQSITADDRWYGPGFYYGKWYDDEDDYWYWRSQNLYYPSNRYYYSYERPIYFYGGGWGWGNRNWGNRYWRNDHYRHGDHGWHGGRGNRNWHDGHGGHRGGGDGHRGGGGHGGGHR